MKESRTKILILIVIAILLILIITSTYSKYQSIGIGNPKAKTAQWNLKVNGMDITANPEDLPKTFLIDKINWNWDKFPTVKKGKVAPGMEGYFDILISAFGTEVTFDYTIEIDDSNISFNGSNLSIVDVRETDGKSNQNFKKDDAGPDIFSRTKPLIESKQVNTLNRDIVRVFVKWENNEVNNDKDSELGMVQDNVITIPITFNAIQKVN